MQQKVHAVMIGLYFSFKWEVTFGFYLPFASLQSSVQIRYLSADDGEQRLEFKYKSVNRRR
jgi:hypothetical protein